MSCKNIINITLQISLWVLRSQQARQRRLLMVALVSVFYCFHQYRIRLPEWSLQAKIARLFLGSTECTCLLHRYRHVDCENGMRNVYCRTALSIMRKKYWPNEMTLNHKRYENKEEELQTTAGFVIGTDVVDLSSGPFIINITGLWSLPPSCWYTLLHETFTVKHFI